MPTRTLAAAFGSLSRSGQGVACCLLLLTSLLLGCDTEQTQGQRVTVDFSSPPLQAQHRGAEELPELRTAVGAMISPKETHALYQELFVYLARQVQRRPIFLQRKTYAEVNALFERQELDLGFLCAGPYVSGKGRQGFELLATPVVNGSHSYHSYLIVHQDSPFQSLADLQGRSFAFTDPQSNTGRLVPLYWLHELGTTPGKFFAKTIFTYSHDNSILAVAQGLVDGAAVDSLIWDYLAARSPEAVARTRIIKVSEPYGIPPLVVSTTLPPELRRELKQALLTMHETPEGAALLHKLLIERFVRPDDTWYDSIRAMLEVVGPQSE